MSFPALMIKSWPFSHFLMILPTIFLYLPYILTSQLDLVNLQYCSNLYKKDLGENNWTNVQLASQVISQTLIKQKNKWFQNLFCTTGPLTLPDQPIFLSIPICSSDKKWLPYLIPRHYKILPGVCMGCCSPHSMLVTLLGNYLYHCHSRHVP